MKLSNKNSVQYFFMILSVTAVVLSIYQWVGRERKIVYVDSARLFNEYKAALKVKEKSEIKRKEYEANVDTLTAELKREISLYDQKMAQLNQAEKKLQEQQLNHKQQELMRYQSAVKEKMAEQEQEELGVVVRDINTFLKKYGEEKGYKLILIASPSGTIAYAEDGLDITSEVLKLLN